MTQRLTRRALQTRIGVLADDNFGPISKKALFAHLSNPKAPPLTDRDYQNAADRLGVPVGHIKGVRKVEAPRGPFDDSGRPSILYEKHVFRRNTLLVGRFDKVDPVLSGGPTKAGGYGLFSAQYAKLADACALDPDAAFKACSWGAFQVLGEGAITYCGYASAYDMARTLMTGEAAHIDSFVRLVEGKHLVDEFRACRPGDPISCQPFVSGYNGTGYKTFNYDKKLAEAIAT